MIANNDGVQFAFDQVGRAKAFIRNSQPYDSSTVSGYNHQVVGYTLEGPVSNTGTDPSTTAAVNYFSSISSSVTLGLATSFLARLGSSGGAVTTGVGYYSAIADNQSGYTNTYAMYHAGGAPSYFGGLTEHAGGVKVTGGDKNTIGKGLVSSSTRLSIQSNRAVDVNSTILSAYHSGNVGNGLNVNSTFDFSSTLINGNIIGIQDVELLNATDNDTLSVFSSSASSVNSPSSSVGTCIGFTASSGTIYGSKLNIGFRGNLNVDGNKNYNFYATGTAPNYFAGNVEIEGFIYTATALNNKDKFLSTSSFKAATGTGSNSGQGAFEVMAVNTGGSSNNAFVFTDTTSASTAVVRGSIKISSSGTNYSETSDYRLKSNIQTLPSSVELIKQLNPVSFDINGVNRRGFIAHELQQVEPIAVDGTKDETEAIGTLADYDGTVLETEVTEPSAEELEYTEEVETDGVATMVTRTRTWTPSGTRPVYQGVDQTKLIPLLTKALQEALDKIETLETRLSDAGIA